MIPELSVATGSVQFTSAENRPRSAYTSNGLSGQLRPNVGARTSEIWKNTTLDYRFSIAESTLVDSSVLRHMW